MARVGGQSVAEAEAICEQVLRDRADAQAWADDEATEALGCAGCALFLQL